MNMLQNIDPSRILKALPITGIGMVGIFVVTVIIIAVVTALNNFTNKD